MAPLWIIQLIRLKKVSIVFVCSCSHNKTYNIVLSNNFYDPFLDIILLNQQFRGLYLYKVCDQSAHEPKLKKINWNSPMKKVGTKNGQIYLSMAIFAYVWKME